MEGRCGSSRLTFVSSTLRDILHILPARSSFSSFPELASTSVTKDAIVNSQLNVILSSSGKLSPHPTWTYFSSFLFLGRIFFLYTATNCTGVCNTERRINFTCIIYNLNNYIILIISVLLIKIIINTIIYNPLPFPTISLLTCMS